MFKEKGAVFARHETCPYIEAMRKMKFSGREFAVLRAIDFAVGSSGADIVERTNIHADEAQDILNGLMEIGLVETEPPREEVEAGGLLKTHFEINPSYAHDLKDALLLRH